MEISPSLEKYRLVNAPPSLFFLPNFLSADEEKALCANVALAPKPKWRQLNGRRVQNWGGAVGKKSLVPVDDVPEAHTDGPAFHPVVATVSLGETALMDFRPRRPTTPERQDDGADCGTINDSTHNRPLGSVFLPRRSLIVLADDCYSDLMHGIEATGVDVLDRSQIWNWNEAGLDECDGLMEVERVNTRYSLTIRNVPKVVKLFG